MIVSPRNCISEASTPDPHVSRFPFLHIQDLNIKAAGASMRLGRLGHHGTLTGTLLFVMNVFKKNEGFEEPCPM